MFSSPSKNSGCLYLCTLYQAILPLIVWSCEVSVMAMISDSPVICLLFLQIRSSIRSLTTSITISYPLWLHNNGIWADPSFGQICSHWHNWIFTLHQRLLILSNLKFIHSLFVITFIYLWTLQRMPNKIWTVVFYIHNSKSCKYLNI